MPRKHRQRARIAAAPLSMAPRDSAAGRRPSGIARRRRRALSVLLGVIFAVPFWVAETAGELIDQRRGSTSAVTARPGREEQTGITATLLVLTLTTIFVLSGGMHWLIDALYRSYVLWPARRAGTAARSWCGDARALGVLDSILASGLLLAVAIGGGDVAGRAVARRSSTRFMPQLNVFFCRCR